MFIPVRRVEAWRERLLIPVRRVEAWRERVFIPVRREGCSYL